MRQNSSKNKFPTKIDFFVLLTIFVSLAGYLTYYIVQSRGQISNLASKLNEQTHAYQALENSSKDLNSKWVSEMNTTSELRGKINKLEAELNKQPSAIYVPQQTKTTEYAPTYKAPTFTECKTSPFGGFYCTTR